MNRRTFLRDMAVGTLALGAHREALGAMPERPNIIWIIVEDMSCHFAYQGERLVKTPHVDRLAAEGAEFRRAYITAPVCSPCRSALITGMYQTSIGVHHHRSSRGTEKIHLPDHVKPVPALFRSAGYYVSNCNGTHWSQRGKTDYNFVFDADLYDGSDWSGRAEGQPFFAQIQLHGGKYRHNAKWRKEVKNPVSPGAVTLPPYYPDHPVFREDWADYLNTVNETDREVGVVMARLAEEGLASNTVVFFMTDHGISQVRGKQFCYEEGVHIPFLVWAPGRVAAGTVRDDFVAHIDTVATSLHFAGIPIPEYMESRPLFGPAAQPRDFVVSARDRCDETVDRIRGVRADDFKYIRNFYPKRPYLQPCAYKDAKLVLKTIRDLHVAGELNAVQSLIMRGTRPPEELYDLRTDPHELTNLAEDPGQRERLASMREILDTWIRDSGDHGQSPESAAMYDSDMAVYVGQMKRYHAAIIEANIRQMKRWAAEGL